MGSTLNMNFWEELAPTAAAPVLRAVVDVEAELDAQLRHLSDVPHLPTVDQQTEAITTGDRAKRSIFPRAAIDVPCRGRIMAVNTDFEPAMGCLPNGCQLW